MRLATAALAGSAVAADHAIHTMNVALPDGSVAKVRYVGDQAPQIAVVPVAMRAAPVAMIDPSFAAFDQMFAAMDAQADAMMQHAAAMAQMPATTAPLQQAALQNAPAGTVSYSYVSTTSSNGCTQSVRETSDGSAGQPQVIRTSVGKCDGAKVMPATATPAAPATTIPAVQVKDAKPAAKPVDPDTI